MASLLPVVQKKKRRRRGRRGSGRSKRTEEEKWNPENPKTPTQKARAVIGNLVKTLQQQEFQDTVGIEVTEVFKGGSMGHGTTVPGKFDIDLVLYSRSLTVEKAVEDGYEDYFSDMGEYLEDKLQGQYTFEDTTKVAIKFSIQPPGQHSIDIDLILSPYFSDHHEYLRAMKRVQPPSTRFKMFSVSSSKYQTEFIQKQHTWAKEFIRRAKAWRNIEWGDSNVGKPKSYMMSILVIIAFDKMSSDMKKIRRGGMHQLETPMTEELKALVCKIDSNPHLDLPVPGSDKSLQQTYEELLPKCPRIIDPTNLANNLYLSGIQRAEQGQNKWTLLAEKIESLDLTSDIMQQHKRKFS